MNLVAKEYVACQVSDPGVLIISPFTGAGETMLEALSVNPLESDMLADCIKKALDMNYYERNLRMNALKTRERLFNIDAWIDSFFEACESIGTSNVAFKALSITDMESWLAPIVTGYKLTLILDYDGTLVPLTSHPDLAILSDTVKGYLEELSNFPEIDVCLLSGRSLENLKKMVQIKNISLAGSHAMELEIAHRNEVIENEQALPFKSKIPELVQDLTNNVCQHGGWVEAKVYHVTFHWRQTDPNFQVAMQQKSKEIIEKHGFQYKEGHFVVEARPPIGWDKGRGAFHILEKIHGITWADNVRVIYIGDDNTDEDAMRSRNGLGISFRVGKPNKKTYSNHRLPDSDSVKIFLKWAVEYIQQLKKFEAKSKRRNQGMIKRK
jgi:trehalose 6-phosphate synthase/phosphatase